MKTAFCFIFLSFNWWSSAQNSTCLNGGSLNNGICECPEGFFGDFCGQWYCYNPGSVCNFMDHCTNDSIESEQSEPQFSICEVTSSCAGSNPCICEKNWTGRFCENPKEKCIHGTGVGNAEGGCVCMQGYKGPKCDLYCPYGAVNGERLCQCFPNAYGVNCDKKMFCRNGGKIIRNNDLAACRCYDGFYGDYCEWKWCKHGTWTNRTSSCHCSPGFTGSRCSQYLFDPTKTRMNIFVMGAVVFAIVLGVMALCLFYFCFWRWRLMSRTDLRGQTVASRVHEVMTHSSRDTEPYGTMDLPSVDPTCSAGDPVYAGLPPPYDQVVGKPPPYSQATQLEP